jgi:hypothetical protein
MQAGFEDRGHARQPELAERAIEFDKIHCGSPSPERIFAGSPT